jgi:hypothetical protein
MIDGDGCKFYDEGSRNMAEAISSENRYPELKTKLDAFANALHTVIAKVPAYNMRDRNLFLL